MCSECCEALTELLKAKVQQQQQQQQHSSYVFMGVKMRILAGNTVKLCQQS